ncbi:MAG: hypothetical protein PHX78_07075 [bacterium]|nr:hypothetical protein [bacterium]
MNPEIIYKNFRDSSLAEMFSSDSYTTFVAMPFRERFNYSVEKIFNEVIFKAVDQANIEKGARLKEFLKPETALHFSGTANVITDEIVKKILASHFFFADLTGGNAGVMLETGIAMAFKSNDQIILVTQDPLDQLHFDIKTNNVIEYNCPNGNVDGIVKAFLSAGENFERERSAYVTQLSESLTTDAIRTLYEYASWYQTEEGAGGAPGLFYPYRMPEFFKKEYGEASANLFQLALKELLEKRMTWTHFTEKDGSYFWATHVTKLGWLFIKNKWPELKYDFCKRIK